MYTIELTFLEAWEALNSLIERRQRLDPRGEPTLMVVNRRVEDKLRAATAIPAPVEPDWSESELRFAYGDR